MAVAAIPEPTINVLTYMIVSKSSVGYGHSQHVGAAKVPRIVQGSIRRTTVCGFIFGDNWIVEHVGTKVSYDPQGL